MRPRHAKVLKGLGFDGQLETFRETLAAVKAESFPGITDEDLIIGKESSATYCTQVRKRLSTPRLTRAIILKGLIGLRKNGKKRERVGWVLASPIGGAQRLGSAWPGP